MASEKVEMKGEMISEAMDMVGDDKLDADADKYYSQVLDEMALEVGTDGVAVPKSKIHAHDEEEVKEGMDDLQARLDALKS